MNLETMSHQMNKPVKHEHDEGQQVKLRQRLLNEDTSSKSGLSSAPSRVSAGSTAFYFRYTYYGVVLWRKEVIF